MTASKQVGIAKLWGWVTWFQSQSMGRSVDSDNMKNAIWARKCFTEQQLMQTVK